MRPPQKGKGLFKEGMSDVRIISMELQDRYQRRINYLRISVTDRCNLRCQYCRPMGQGEFLPHGELLTFEEILQVVRVLADHGVKKVRLTGGEPLLRKGLTELVSGISSVEGIEDISLTTNGVLLAQFAKRLKEAGLKRVNISLDSLRPDRFAAITQRDAFQRVWEGIEVALAVGLEPVKINVVAMRGFNDDEIENFARLTFELPLHVRFIEFMPVGPNSWEQTRVIPCEEIIERVKALDLLIPIPSGETDGPARRFKFKGAKGELGFISPLSSHFCSRCNRLRLTPDGKLRACLFSDYEVDLKALLRTRGTEGVLLALREALASKPQVGVLDGFRIRKCQRAMNEIGG